MNDLKRAFSLPIKGLHDGFHAFDFIVDSEFLKRYEGSLVKKGRFDVQLSLEKKPSLLVLDFICEGHVSVPCDRCLTEISIEIAAEQQNLVKYSEEDLISDEVLYIPYECEELDVSDMIYEIIHLNLPLTFIKDCEEEGYQNCDTKTLDYLISEDEESTEEEGNDIWGDLKNIKFK